VTSAAETDGVAASRLAHGGDLSELKRLFPHAPQPLLDLSTGINPVAYPLPPLPPETHARLPQPGDLAALEAAASAAYRTHPGMTVAAPGTQALIQLLPRLIPPGDVAVLAPTYEEHARAWSLAGHRVRTARDVAGLRGAAVAVLVNPNNPTGELHERPGIVALLREPGSPGLLIVDEAFADFLAPEQSCASLAVDYPVVVLRSFGKTYGLAGIRLGFAVAGPSLAAGLRAALGPWPVSGLAVAAGCAALPDRAWLDNARERLAGDGQRLGALLQETGARAEGATPLFRLVSHDAAQRLFARLAGAGIWVRRFPAEPAWLRFGIPGHEQEWARLDAALRS
jgi:cobalamin biosynthetic protein CobC